MSFRFFPVGVQFFTNDGQVLAGGTLTFTDSGTTNPRTTWSDPAMTTPNSNPVEIDGAGRPDTDIWGDGNYRVVLKNSQGATVAMPLDNVSGPVGIPDPTLQAGKFLSNDGTVVSWQSIRQVPDPTGQPDGHVLTTDGGGNTAWESPASSRQVPDPAGVTDGWVVTRDDASPGDYAWKALPSVAGRNWQDVTASRVLGNVYNNGTGQTIQVAFIANCKRASAGGTQFVAQVDSVSVGVANAPGSSDVVSTITFDVPAGSNYSVSNSGSFNSFGWSELRA